MTAGELKSRVLEILKEDADRRRKLGEDGHKIDDYQYDIALAIDLLVEEIEQL